MSADDEVFPAEPTRAVPKGKRSDFERPASADSHRELNAGLDRWLEECAQLAECVTPFEAEIGQYAHRLAIPGDNFPRPGDRRVSHGRGWEWEAPIKGWRRVE
jgi:hypothetical protein